MTTSASSMQVRGLFQRKGSQASSAVLFALFIWMFAWLAFAVPGGGDVKEAVREKASTQPQRGVAYSALPFVLAQVLTPTVELSFLIDGSNSVPPQDFSTMVKGIADAIVNPQCVPQNGTLELTVIQFSDSAKIEVDPTTITSLSDATRVAERVRSIVKLDAGTNYVDAFNLAVNTMRFVGARQVINFTTDGQFFAAPNELNPNPIQNAIDHGVDEIDAEKTGGADPIAVLRDQVVYPQPGTLAWPPQKPGWVRVVNDAREFAASVCQKFQFVQMPILELSKDSYTAWEEPWSGSPGEPNGVVTATLQGTSGLTVTVEYQIEGRTATEGSDFTPLTDTLVFPPNTSVQSFTVTANPDGIYEVSPETATIQLFNVTNALLGRQVTATLNVIDFDASRRPSVQFALSSDATSETRGAYVATVNLSPASGVTATVNYATVAGQAAANEDFVPVSGTLIFPPGVVSQSISIPILGDQLVEGNEAFAVVLSDATEATLGAAVSSTVTILDSNTSVVTVFNDDGKRVAKAEVHVYRNATGNDVEIVTACTDANGQAVLATILPGDKIYVLSQRHEQPAIKDFHTDNTPTCANDTPNPKGWAYRVYITNMDVLSDGTISVPPVQQLGEQVITVSRYNPLVLFNMVVTLERPPYKSEDQADAKGKSASRARIIAALRSASNYLYDATDGQFGIGKVTLYYDGKNLEDADIRVVANKRERPRAILGGETGQVYTTTNGLRIQHENGWVLIPSAWKALNHDGDEKEQYKSLDVLEGYRTLGHELGHYLFGLGDEYFGHSEDERARCTQDRSSEDNPGNASIMGKARFNSEFSARGSKNWTADCEKTDNWYTVGESNWETIVRMYADRDGSVDWVFTTPASVTWSIPVLVGPVNPGPNVLPITTFPRVVDNPAAAAIGIEVDEDKNVTITNSLTTNKGEPKCEAFVIKRNERKDIVAIIPEGETDKNGVIELSSAGDKDEVVCIGKGGVVVSASTFHSPPSTGNVFAQPAPWNPFPNLVPSPNWSGVTLTISQTNQVTISGTITAILVERGGRYTQTVQMPESSTPGVYIATIPFKQKKPAKDGNILMQAQSTSGLPLKAMTSYAVRGAPGWYAWEIAPFVVDSADGGLNARFPKRSVPTDTLVAVIPLQWTPPIQIGQVASAQQGGEQASAGISNLQVVDTAYSIRAAYPVTDANGIVQAVELTQAASFSLTISFDSQALDGITDTNSLKIYYYNEAIKQWEYQGGNLNEEQTSLTASVNRFGIYAIAAPVPTTIELTTGWNIFQVHSAQSVPIEQILQPCNDQYDMLYTSDPTDVNDPWKRYIAKAPKYANDLEDLHARVNYLIHMKTSCTLTFDGGVQATSVDTTMGQISSVQASVEPRLLPSGFYGTVKNNGQNVPSGTKISVCINGVPKCIETSSFDFEGQSVYRVDFPADDPDTIEIEGGKVVSPPQEVNFKVILEGNEWKDQDPFVPTWQDGGVTIQKDIVIQTTSSPETEEPEPRKLFLPFVQR